MYASSKTNIINKNSSLFIQNIVGLALLSTSLLGLNELYLTIVLIFLFLCCQGFIFPNASALSMAPFGHNAGSASALMGFIQMSIGAFMSALVSFLQDGTSLPMTGIMAFCSISAFLLLLLGRKIVINKASRLLVEEEDVEMINTL